MFPSARISFLMVISATILTAVGAASAQESSSAAKALQMANFAVPGANLAVSPGSAGLDTVSAQSRPHLIRAGRLIKIPEGSPLRAELAVEAVEAKEVQRRLKLNAEADPSRTVQVLPAVVGRVVDLKVELGDRVTQGQELAIVYAGVAAEHLGATAVLTANDYQREVAGDCPWSVTAMARSAALRCVLIVPTEATLHGQFLSLRAPMSGSVLNVQIGLGTVLDDPASSIMTIANLEEVWVTASLRKKDMTLFAADQPVEVAFIAYPDEVFIGDAHLVDDTPDDAGHFKVKIELQNPARRLKPNMYALATFRGPTETAPIIPATALIRRNDRDLVFVEVERWTFEARPVEIGFTRDGQTIAMSGVNIGEHIVVMAGALRDD
jgi:membrane fusion protein, heavy metal efflux system